MVELLLDLKKIQVVSASLSKMRIPLPAYIINHPSDSVVLNQLAVNQNRIVQSPGRRSVIKLDYKIFHTVQLVVCVRERWQHILWIMLGRQIIKK